MKEENIDQEGIEFYEKWKEITLDEIVSKLGDGLHGTPNYDENGEYYFINGNNLIDGKIVIKDSTQKVNYTEFSKYRKELNDRTILLGINGTIGNVALYNNEKCILGKSACYFNVIKSVDKQFIKYVITDKSFQSYIENFANGTTIKNVSLKSIREFEFLLPPLPEQTAIASILSSLDDKIDLLHRQNKTLEQLAETLFRQWFVEEAEESWEVNIIGNLGRVVTGKTPSTANKTYWGEEIMFITPTDFKNFGKYVTATDRFITTKGMETVKNAFIPKGSIIVTCIGSDMGKVAITLQTSVTNQQINSLVINENFTYPEYIYQYLKSIYPLLQSMASGGSTMPIINKNDFQNIEIPIPPIKILLEYERLSLTFNKKILNNQTQIRTLTQLRDTLLPKLMSGEVRVEI